MKIKKKFKSIIVKMKVMFLEKHFILLI